MIEYWAQEYSPCSTGEHIRVVNRDAQGFITMDVARVTAICDYTDTTPGEYLMLYTVQSRYCYLPEAPENGRELPVTVRDSAIPIYLEGESK